MSRNNGGFTLIEFLVSIVILMVGLLGLLQTVNVALSHNLITQMRNEAVAVADNQMSIELGKGFDNVSTTPKNDFERRPVLNGFKNFSFSRSGATMSNSKQVNFEVRWNYKGSQYNHNLYGGISKTNK